jgi:hypothetical protein
MMRILCIVLLISLSQTGRSQILISILFGDKLNSGKMEFGLMVSPTLCNITDIDAKYRTGLALGLYLNLKITDRFFFHPEAIPKSALGANKLAPYPSGDTTLDRLFADGSVQRKIKAISVPLLCRYRIGGLWFIEAGPQIDWMLKTTDEFKTKANGGDLSFSKEISDQFTRFDVGLAGGLVYKFKSTNSMSLGIRYFYGLTDIIKTSSGSQHNSAWLLNVYIPVGAGKAEAKQKAKMNSQKTTM